MDSPVDSGVERAGLSSPFEAFSFSFDNLWMETGVTPENGSELDLLPFVSWCSQNP